MKTKNLILCNSVRNKAFYYMKQSCENKEFAETRIALKQGNDYVLRSSIPVKVSNITAQSKKYGI